MKALVVRVGVEDIYIYIVHIMIVSGKWFV